MLGLGLNLFHKSRSDTSVPIFHEDGIVNEDGEFIVNEDGDIIIAPDVEILEPINPTPIANTEDSITVGWTKPMNGLQYQVAYDLYNGGIFGDPENGTLSALTATDAESLEITNLDPNDYVFWVRSHANGVYSDWVYANSEITEGYEP